MEEETLEVTILKATGGYLLTWTGTFIASVRGGEAQLKATTKTEVYPEDDFEALMKQVRELLS